MNQQANDAITSALQQDWQPICHSILERFTTVSKADLDAALDADDLVHRITSITKYDPAYVESEVAQLVGVGAGNLSAMQGQFQQGQQFQQGPQQQWTQGQQFQGQRGQQRSRRGGQRRQQQPQAPLGTYN